MAYTSSEYFKKVIEHYHDNAYNEHPYSFYETSAQIDAYYEAVSMYYDSMGYNAEMADHFVAEDSRHFFYLTEEEMLEHEFIEETFAYFDDYAIDQAKSDAYLVSLLDEDEEM
jgi:hypothetical protein